MKQDLADRCYRGAGLQFLACAILVLMAAYPIFGRLRYQVNGLIAPDIVQLAGPLFIPYLVIGVICIAALMLVVPQRWDLLAPILFVLFVHSLFPIMQLPRFFVPVSDDFFYHFAVGRATLSGYVPQTSDLYTRYVGFPLLVGSLMTCSGLQSVYGGAVLSLCLNAVLDFLNVVLMYKIFVPFMGRSARVVPLMFYAVNTAILGTIDILGPSKLGFTLLLLSAFLLFKVLRESAKTMEVAKYTALFYVATATIVIVHPVSAFAMIGMMLAFWIFYWKKRVLGRRLFTLFLLAGSILVVFVLFGPPAGQAPLALLRQILSFSLFELHFTYTVPFVNSLISQAIYWYSRGWYVVVGTLAIVCFVRALQHNAERIKVVWVMLFGLLVGLLPFMVIAKGAWSNRLLLLGMLPLSGIAVFEAARHRRFLTLLTLALVVSGPCTFVLYHQVTFPFSVNAWDFSAFQFLADHQDARESIYAPSVKALSILAFDYPGRPYSVRLYSAWDFLDVSAAPPYGELNLWFMSWRESAFSAYATGNPDLYLYEQEQSAIWSQTPGALRMYDDSYNKVFVFGSSQPA